MSRSFFISAALLVLANHSLIAQDPAPPPVKLAEVIVTPSHFGVADERTTVPATLTSTELEVLPQIGDDLYRSIARLPGLAADDFTARFWVRGAPNSELLARLDGVDLIEPFHLKDVDGALSIVDPAVIHRLDLSTGGFTAEAGGRLAGVLTMETKRAAAPATALELSLTGIGANHQGTSADHKARWLVTARRGYPDVALRVAHRDDDVTPRYYDAMAKFEYQLAPEQTLSVHVLHAGDTLRYQRTNDPSLTSSYDSDYVWARWEGVLTPALSGEAVLSGTRLTWHRDGAGALDGFPFALHDRRRLDVAALRNDWTLTLGERSLVRGGIEAKTGEARYDYTLSHQVTVVSAGRQIAVADNINATRRPGGSEAAGFVSARVAPISALVIEPGLRFEHYDYSHDSDWNPRLNAALTMGRTVVRAAWGIYSQAQGLHELHVADGDMTFRPAEHAEHRVLGFDRPVGGGISLRVEAYERISTRLRPRWENLDNPYDLFPEAQSDRVRIDPQRGRARGVEVMLAQRASGHWNWNASYALARAEEEVGGRWVPRARDQRHAFYGDVTYVPNPRWQFSAAWQYHTGWPTTDVVYSLATLTNGRRVAVAANGPLYGLRMADYHRLDLRATRRWKLSRGDLRTFVDLFNVYDRTNIIGYDHRITISGTQITDVRKPREQLPFLPSLGAEWQF
jgi:hypothetical protein